MALALRAGCVVRARSRHVQSVRRAYLLFTAAPLNVGVQRNLSCLRL